MTLNPHFQKEIIINKFVDLSQKYHKLSLLFYELSQSLKASSHNKSYKEFKEYLKSLNLDIDKIKNLSKGMMDLGLEGIQKEK